uniref:Uncharacterized protein n=1 Tax=Heterorhabditis bacteriophora TaxID=37862 RepID=A0A1I7WTP8_HETBA
MTDWYAYHGWWKLSITNRTTESPVGRRNING